MANQEPRPRKQLRGRLSEAVTIVGSILLAFAIDAWWGHRSNGISERGYLEELATEMPLDL